jgi:O-antigen ligase
VASIAQIDDVGGNSNLQRAQLLQASADLVANHPLAGVGVDQVRAALFESSVAGLAHAEDGYLNALIEYGVLGLVVTLAFSAWPIARCSAVRDDALVRAATCGLAAMAADTLVNTPLAAADFWVLPLFLAAAGQRAHSALERNAA